MITPIWFVPKRRILKVVQERTQETMQYVNIDSSVKAGDKELLSGYKESLARFAQRHNVAINFKTAEGNNSSTLIDVYKTHLTPKAIERKNQGNWFLVTPEYKGEIKLPDKNKDDYCKALKEMIKEVANKVTENINSKKYPQQIRHENKYFKPGDK